MLEQFEYYPKLATGGRACCVAGEMATAEGGTHPAGMHSCVIVCDVPQRQLFAYVV